MGHPRLSEEKCQAEHQNDKNSSTKSRRYSLHLQQIMGSGDVKSSSSGGNVFPPPLQQQQQIVPQTQSQQSLNELQGRVTWGYPMHNDQHYSRCETSSGNYHHGNATKRNNSWNHRSSGRVSSQGDENLKNRSCESSPNLSMKHPSYESLIDPVLDDAQSAKRLHYDGYAIPSYHLTTNFYHQFNPDFMAHTYHQQQQQQQQYNQYYPVNTSNLKRRHRNPPYSTPMRNNNGIIAPDRFLRRAHLLHVTSTPSQLLIGGEWDGLSEEIWKKFMANQQTEDMFKRKMFLWKHLYLLIRGFYPRYGLYLVGSTMTGLGSNTSDVDMCLLVRPTEMDQRGEAVFHLTLVHQLLQDQIKDPELIQAKVPILKFRDPTDGLEVDLNCNNAVGIRNTHLLYCYANLDWRVRPLVLVVKVWAQCQGINDAKNMTISSYSLALMVINYLQCGTSPAVLPSLQLMYPGKFHAQSMIPHIDLHEELPTYETDNTQTLGELMLGFLEYYASKFDFTKVAASVRIASTISIDECRRAKSLKNDPHQWKYLCIEEPFELTNTARSVYDRMAFERVKSVFVNSWQNLKSERTLDSIFETKSKKQST